MSNQNEIINHQITEAEFVAIYGDNPVTLPGVPADFTVKDALAMEADFCPANPEKRADERLRLEQLAMYVGETALLPEHRALLAKEKQ